MLSFIPSVCAGELRSGCIDLYRTSTPGRRYHCSVSARPISILFLFLEFGSFFSSIVVVLIRVWKVNSRNAALFEDFLVARGKANLDQTTVTTAAVSTDETARLISDSTKPGYIDGKTGERSDQSTSGAGLTSQAGPSTQLSAASAPIIESTVSDSDLKPADKRRSRWWFSRKTEGKDS